MSLRGHRARIRLVALLVASGAALGVMASLAEAELSVSGDLFVTFNGGIIPHALPRHTPAPITVWISGRVRTLSGTRPPALRQIVIMLNRQGQLDTRGLPSCRKRQLEATTGARALASCGDALVGSGKYRARIALPEQKPAPASGSILAFNGRSHGKPIILAQVSGRIPAPSTVVIVFKIHHSGGIYGTTLTGALPPSLNRWGYLKRISLRLHRTYSFHGRVHSYLSAPCPAPPGASDASFNFAFSSMTFSDGRSLSATLTRTCNVK